MNIAFLTTEYVTEPEFDGGLANYLYRVTQTLISSGHHVEVFTLSHTDNKIYHQGAIVHQVRNKSDFFDFLIRLTRYKFKRTFRFLSLSYCLRKRFLKSNSIHRFDIIQASSCFACGLFSTFSLFVPIVTRVSSLEYLWERIYRRPLTLDQRICEWLELFAIRRSNGAYTPSEFLAKILNNQKRITTKVLRPPFSVEIEYLDENIYKKHLSGRKYFLFFGTIGFLKGCEIIAQSLSGLLSKYPEMYFVFVGKVREGPQGLTMLEYIIQESGIYKDRIVYLGILNHAQLYPVIKHSHGVVLPSLIDNFPNTMLETMAFGKVVIGTKGASFDEMIEHDVSGILIEPNDSKALSKAMEIVWNMTEAKIERIGKAAQARVDRLSPEIARNKLEDYFQRIITANV